VRGKRLPAARCAVTRRRVPSAETLEGRQCQFPLYEPSENSIIAASSSAAISARRRGQPSALKRGKSAFLLVGHGPLISALPTPAPQVV